MLITAKSQAPRPHPPLQGEGRAIGAGWGPRNKDSGSPHPGLLRRPTLPLKGRVEERLVSARTRNR